MRIGHGYDVHRLVRGRDLIIGGVKIDYEFGLLGHSDADVLLHAVSDALLGSAALGDIGCYSIDLVMNALGNPKPLTVTGTATDYFGKTPEAYAQVGKPECAEKFSVDDFASAYIRLEGGIVLDFRIAWYMHLDTPGDTIILGTKGGLRIPSTECWNGTVGGPMKIYHEVCGEQVETEIPTLELKGLGRVERKVRSFLDAVITRGAAPVPTSQILINQAIIDGIARSADEGREVKIEIPEI